MIYAPENVRIQGDFAVFIGTDNERLAIRMASIESVKAKYCSIDRCWELTVRMESSLKHRFTFSAIGNVLELLIGGGDA